ncbi:MAG TPA: ROK family protein [Nocardioides sp.]|uniref:ROK family protein n=1 Tax=Nocardioides sp. TaxID=35761 RepID=UPI002E30BAF1|nr:ROK family protein [Nocardioides sp.]HEX5086873.1 ROK family protein [Nocardioides sp.]
MARTPPPGAAAAARQATIRDTNLRLVLSTVLGSAEPVSRAGVAGATALTRSTVSRLTDELVGAGLVDELEPLRAPGRGRPGTPLVAGRGVAALGLQVNPGFSAARVVDLQGRIVEEHLVTEDLVGSDPGEALRRIGELARRLRRGLPPTLRLVGAGLALPGVVSVEDAVLLSAPNLGWSEVDVPALLDLRALGNLPLRVANEADLAARTVAEVVPGRSGPLSDFVYVSGEVGIGGAAVIGGRVFAGRHGWAGEIGHVAVDPRGPACPCGSTGCLEQYAGRRAMLRTAGLPAGAPMALLAQRVRSGDAAARTSLDAAARALGVALSSVLNVLDISTVVLGGHLAETAELIRPSLEQHLHERVISALWLRPAVEVAGQDDAPGATGAAFAVLDAVIDHPAGWVDR